MIPAAKAAGATCHLRADQYFIIDSTLREVAEDFRPTVPTVTGHKKSPSA